MTDKINLSVIIICKNEEHCIRHCLESIKWADEIIVLDSGSTDQTIAICREYTDHVFETDWPGFGKQKNRALEKANGEWVLSIDADEWPSEALIDEIQHVTQQPANTAYIIPRKTSYCGHFVQHGNWGSDKVLRLFPRTKTQFTNDLVHERAIPNVKIKHLSHPIMHDSIVSFEDALQIMNSYSTLSAKQRFDRGTRTSFSKAIYSSMWMFCRSYFLKLGFLDGKFGLVTAINDAQNSYYRYLKLWLLQRNAKQAN